jgi:D-lactate dehydrogenase (cytochrome)
LLGTGFRVPYLGTLSGNHATIGGGLSQNATGMGRMTLAEHVLGLEVVLGTGEIVKTGSWATSGTRPFYRYNGPDLTGMFLCDSGAFGIKTRVHLILEPVPKVSFVCVSFPTRLAMVAAQVAIAQTGLQTEAFAFDDRYIREYANHPSPPKQETRRMVRQYLSEHPARIRAYRNLLRAWHPSGLGFLKDKCNVMYFIAEAHHQTEADRMAREIAAITRKHGGYQMPTSIPFGLRYGPFLNVGDLMANSAGEVNFPINGKFAATQAVDVMRAFEEFLSQNKATLEKHEIRIACNTLLHGHFWGIEPIINWQRPLTSYRAHFANDEKRARSANIPENSERTRIAIEMRYRLTKLLRSMGSLHVQWAKAYPYAQALDGEATWDLLNRLKQVNDPDNILNPGVLGLGL